MSTAATEQGTTLFWRESNLPFEGRQSFDSAACYREHTHPTFSIGIVDQGKSLLSLPDRTFEMTAGNVVMIWPGQVHACNPQPSSRWSYRMFYLDWEWVQSVIPAGAEDASRSGLEPLLRTPAASRLVDRMTAVVSQDACPADKLSRMRVCLVDLYKLTASVPPTPHHPITLGESSIIRRARNYIETHVGETIEVRKLAKNSGLTSFQFIRKFGREVGLTPHAYQLDQRVSQARELLKQQRSLADVAYALGFSDQSHFQRVFKRRVAATPGQYREGGAHFSRRKAAISSNTRGS